MRRRMIAPVALSKKRMPISMKAVSGMTLQTAPAFRQPTVITAGLSGSTLRATIDCIAMTSEAPATIGSIVLCGSAPCPPLPLSVICT